MSSSTEGYKAAFPVPHDLSEYGMTLRDWFAGQALAALPLKLLDASVGGLYRAEEGVKAARMAYAYADAMLAERKKEP